jgi:glutathione S-transferase
MITVHHLEYSRSTRILWLLEELGEPYNMVRYQRDPKTMRSPDALKAVHPLGKSPLIEEDGRMIVESGAIIEYLVNRYGLGRLGPKPDDPQWLTYIEWLHFAEGTAMLGPILSMLGRDAVSSRAQNFGNESTSLALSHIERGLAGREYLVGNALTGADVQILFVVDLAFNMGLLGDRPTLIDYRQRLTQRPAYLRAIEKGGPTTLPRLRPAAATGS